MHRFWKNKKNGNTYIVYHEAIDCTNERDGLEVVVYGREGKMFVRSKEEFLLKFTEA